MTDQQGIRYDSIHKFGHNPDIDTGTDPEDVWSQGGIYAFPTAAAATTIVSTSTSDAAAGTGARTVFVEGLDGNYLTASEIVTMNGTNAVTLSTQYLRINRVRVITHGSDSGKSNVGVITVLHGATVLAHIIADHGQTLQAVYTVAANFQVAYLAKWYCSMERSGGAAGVATILLCMADVGEAMRVTEHVELRSDGNSIFQYEFPFWIEIAPKTDISIRVNVVSANDTAVSGGFDLLLCHKIPNFG